MKVLLTVLALCLALAASAGAAPTAQPLSISIHGDGAQATRLPQYDPAIPIAVKVMSGGTEKLDSLIITASGPAGESVRVPLMRTADGSFTGALALGTQGAWSLRLISQTGRVTIDTLPVALTVAAPPPSNAPIIGFAVGAAIFVLVGGSGFLVLRRAVGTRATNELEPAA